MISTSSGKPFKFKGDVDCDDDIIGPEDERGWVILAKNAFWSSSPDWLDVDIGGLGS